MKPSQFDLFSEKSLSGVGLSDADCEAVLQASHQDLLPLLQAAYHVRQAFWQNKVTVHILDNVQNGNCPEDCGYCAQAKTSDADIEDYWLKSEEEILADAKRAHENGAFRFCMVSSGRGPTKTRARRLADLISKVKSEVPIQVCLSAGLMDEETTRLLKEAGLDRLNHNLNSSEAFYPKFCTTHTYQDRVNTLSAGKEAGLELCSGVIVGMGETHQDLINTGRKLQALGVVSIPVNFFIPIPGAAMANTELSLTPLMGLKVLCLFRFLNPWAEIRVAAGREMHLRGMEVMALYPANSLFLQGYLNVIGNKDHETFQMIKDAGFEIESTLSLDDLLASRVQPVLKTVDDLRPCKS